MLDQVGHLSYKTVKLLNYIHDNYVPFFKKKVSFASLRRSFYVFMN